MIGIILLFKALAHKYEHIKSDIIEATVHFICKIVCFNSASLPNIRNFTIGTGQTIGQTSRNLINRFNKHNIDSPLWQETDVAKHQVDNPNHKINFNNCAILGFSNHW